MSADEPTLVGGPIKGGAKGRGLAAAIGVRSVHAVRLQNLRWRMPAALPNVHLPSSLSGLALDHHAARPNSPETSGWRYASVRLRSPVHSRKHGASGTRRCSPRAGSPRAMARGAQALRRTSPQAEAQRRRTAQASSTALGRPLAANRVPHVCRPSLQGPGELVAHFLAPSACSDAPASSCDGRARRRHLKVSFAELLHVEIPIFAPSAAAQGRLVPSSFAEHAARANLSKLMANQRLVAQRSIIGFGIVVA